MGSRMMFVRCPWEVVPESTLRRRSRMTKSARMVSSSLRNGCKNTTFIPTRGVRLSFAILKSTKERIAEVANNRYSYRQLDDFTDLIQRTLQRVPEVAKVQRVGVLPEEIYLEYSDARLAALKLQPTKIKDILNARNVTAPGGIVQTQSRNVLVDATAEFKSTKDIGNVLLASPPGGAPLYLRDLVTYRVPIKRPPGT